MPKHRFNEGHNAPIDPLGDVPASPEGLARTFRFLRARFVLASEGPLPALQELSSLEDAWFPAKQVPALVLFVSHRWTSHEHPDRTGEQTEALRSLLASLRALTVASLGSLEDRLRSVPRLDVHGLFQAAWILGNQRGFGDGNEYGWGETVDRLREKGDPETVADALLIHPLSGTTSRACPKRTRRQGWFGRRSRTR